MNLQATANHSPDCRPAKKEGAYGACAPDCPLLLETMERLRAIASAPRSAVPVPRRNTRLAISEETMAEAVALFKEAWLEAETPGTRTDAGLRAVFTGLGIEIFN